MVIYLSLAVALIGLLLFLLADRPAVPGGPTPGYPNAKRIGEIMMLAGGLAFLLVYVPHALIGRT